MSGTVMVVGGAGYIGSQACKTLSERGFTPVAFDNYATGWRDAVRYGPKADGDLRDPDSLRAALKTHQPVGVMHFAALSLVGESMTEPRKYYENNVLGTKNLVEAMLDVDGTPPALIFSSTCAVYGEVDSGLLDETTPCAPISAYGRTKLCVEHLLTDYAAAYGLRRGSFRYFNVAGADPSGEIGELHVPETHLIPLALDAALGERAGLKLFGTDYPTPDGTCIRHYIHVEDLIDAHVAGLQRILDGGDGFTLNLGTGTGYSVRAVIDVSKAVSGLDFPVEEVARRPGDPAKLVSASERAADLIGWRPVRSLEDMVRDAWRWRTSDAFERRRKAIP